MKVKIEVSSNDILLGVRFSTRECPISPAVSRVVKRGYRVYVAGNLWIEPDAALVTLPRSADRFRTAFDLCKPVNPFRFVVDLPVDVLKRKRA